MLGDASEFKIRQSIIALKAGSVKVPAKRDEFFIKGLSKFEKYIVTGLNALALGLGSFDSDAENQRSSRQGQLYG